MRNTDLGGSSEQYQPNSASAGEQGNSKQIFCNRMLWPFPEPTLLSVTGLYAGEDALPSFKYLMASGAKYNQQAWKELGDLPPTPPSPTRLTNLTSQKSGNLKAFV